MSITLTWDLFIIVFFALVITYSFIIGRKESAKIIIATYIAIVAVQGIGNVLERALRYGKPVLTMLGMDAGSEMLSVIKLFLFVAVIIALAIRSGIQIVYAQESGAPLQAAFTVFFGFSTAGLLLSTLLTYIARTPLLDQKLPSTEALTAILQGSSLMQLMILNQDLWFSLPAIGLLAAGAIGNRS